MKNFDGYRDCHGRQSTFTIERELGRNPDDRGPGQSCQSCHKRDPLAVGRACGAPGLASSQYHLPTPNPFGLRTTRQRLINPKTNSSPHRYLGYPWNFGFYIYVNVSTVIISWMTLT